MINLRLLISMVPLFFAVDAAAHEGHDHAPGEEQAAVMSGPVSISPTARENLQIKVHEAGMVTIEETIPALGQIEPIPGRAAAISSRIAGRVSALKVNDGERVRKNQPLVEVESRQLGDPPPRVTYTAPFDGVVIDRHAALGETVDPDRHLMEVVDLSEVYAAGRVHEGQIALLKPGQSARVAVEAFPDEIFTGSVELISGSLDPETRTLRVWVRLDNAEGKLRPNMGVTLNIIVNQAASAIGIPHSAVLGDTGEKFVFVESEGDPLTFERRPVVTGIRDDRYIEIVQGVYPGDRVVTEGAYQLQYVAPKPAEDKEK